uniref:Uncharacterized protein n=1 Tax=viral metagenome TaxID=1070528 RepID=A0A6C0D241_9ZZZZ
MSVEPILNPDNSQLTMFPIKYDKIRKCYKDQVACFWTPEEIDFSKDYEDFLKCSPDEQHFIKMILAFFASSDGIVNWNLSERFIKDVQIMEAKTAYTFQMAMENIHSEVYSLMLENLIKNKDEKTYLFEAIKTVDSVKLMSEWAIRWISSSESYAKRLVAFAIIEGIMFSGAFAAIFWIKKYKGNGSQFLQGLVKSNEFIARDEGLHTVFACEMYKLLENKLTQEELQKIIKEGVIISKIFITESLPCRLIGINSDSMCQYIEYVADTLSINLGYNKIYNSDNPFSFMNTIGMTQKTNFFESRPTEYQRASVFNTSKVIINNEDF